MQLQETSARNPDSALDLTAKTYKTALLKEISGNRVELTQ
jgi:hypothetical protein